MKRPVLKIIALFFILTFIGGYVSLNALAQTKNNSFFSGSIIYTDQNMGFVIIDLGKEDGIDKSCLFEVYRGDVKIGEIKTVKVRRRFSAADIEYTYRNKFMKVGDRLQSAKRTVAIFRPQEEASLREKLNELFIQAQKDLKNKDYKLAEEKIREALQLDPENKKALKMLTKAKQALLHKKINELLNQAKRYLEEMDYKLAEEKIREALQLDPKNKKTLKMLTEVKAAPLLEKLEELFIKAQAYLKEMEYELAGEKIREVLQLDPENKTALKMLRKVKGALRTIISIEPETIIVDINAPKNIIHSTVIDVLRKYGCLVNSSNPVKYSLQASKNKRVPLIKDIISEWGPFTRNKIYYTVEVEELPKSDYLVINRLIIHLRGVYDREGQLYNYRIKRSSTAYKEAQEMVCSIKYLAESL